MPLTTKGFPPVAIDAIIPPVNITHLPTMSNSGGVHSFIRRPAIIFDAPIGVALSIIYFTSKASPTDDITGPT